jgi:predicted nucleic acid-binding protein
MTPVVYDAAVLIAADRNARTVWAEHRARLEAGIVPVVPSPVVVQVSRSPAQVQLRRLLQGCEVVSLTEQRAHSAGRLLGRAGSADVVDAVVADTAAGLRANVVTGDRGDIRRLLDAADASCQIIDVQRGEKAERPPPHQAARHA